MTNRRRPRSTPAGTRSARTRIGTQEPPRIRVTSPADLVRLAPYLLGFHPEQSLVLLGLARGRVVVTTRMDLADAVGYPGPVPPVAALSRSPRVRRGLNDDTLTQTLAAMADGGAERVVTIVFDDDCTELAATAAVAQARPSAAARSDLPWHALIDLVHDRSELLGLLVADALLVAGGRWWSYHCADPVCCPVAGTVLDDDSLIPATAAFAGMVALRDRESVGELLEPDQNALQGAEDLAAELIAEQARAREIPDPERWLRSVKRALFAGARAADAARPAVTVERQDLVRFGAALTTIAVRDATWLAIDNARLDGREFWRHLGRHLPDPFAAPPLFLFGWASWRAGNGALAGMAAERTLAADPSYSAADLLLAAVQRGINPKLVPRLRQRSA